MRSVSTLFIVFALAAAGYGVSAARAQQKAASGPSMVVYKSPT